MQKPANLPKFSYIIPFRFQNDRIMNLKRVLEWVSGFSGVEVILVEQDSHSKISHLSLKAKHIFIKNSGAFNKNWALNVGFRNALSDILVFGDSDLIMNPEHLIQSLEQIRDFEFVNPYQSVIDLELFESQLSLQEIVSIGRPGRGETDHQKVPICGGITIFRKEALHKIGGWSEMFWGWGAEDDFQSLKVKELLNWKQMPFKCYHLWHNRLAPDMNLYQRNLQIYNKFLNASKDELRKQIMSESNKIGLLNKCL